MIATHHAPHCSPPWIAVDMDKANRLLDGYGLTELEKTSLPDMMARFCRLVDEADLCHYGDTEEEAIQSAQKP